MQSFRAMGASPQTPETASPLQISGYALESNHVFFTAIFYVTRVLPDATF